ncbi:hepatocellular carcinoma-associated antigen, putative [Ixodes scapularis]|uniref:Hepatocellular carcinoma-associated antigen, putative n=1 Tax=Ixodes scapularis TaxID=6945 RepID=B7P1U2_IXOSC|nr:hepatocellular carcinoma-associated antigen, putative [Ixodes scapularis]|eukprot:XP_002433500.1 hepatocellular carcinoma-associated antigen, putative [Ixodes scapularis]
MQFKDDVSKATTSSVTLVNGDACLGARLQPKAPSVPLVSSVRLLNTTSALTVQPTAPTLSVATALSTALQSISSTPITLTTTEGGGILEVIPQNFQLPATSQTILLTTPGQGGIPIATTSLPQGQIIIQTLPAEPLQSTESLLVQMNLAPRVIVNSDSEFLSSPQEADCPAVSLDTSEIDASSYAMCCIDGEEFEVQEEAAATDAVLAAKIPSLVYKAATKAIPEKMWKLYIQFYLELLEKSHSQKNAEKRLLRVLDIMKRASDENQLTLEHHLEWVKLLQNCGEADAAATCAEAGAEKWDRSTEAWLLLLEMQILQSLETDAVRATFERALKHVPKEESLPIWQFGVTWMSAACPTKTIEFLEGGLYFPPAVCIYIKEKLLELNCLYHGYKAARKFYKRMLLLKPLSLGFFQAMVNIENAHATPSAHRLRGYFEDATLEFGQSCAELWLKYITFELKHAEGKPECAGVLYQRAVKALKDELVDEFIARYTLLDPGQAEMDD